MVARVLTICVSRKKLVQFKGRTISTGIFKTPIEGKVQLSLEHLDGDEQADLTVHGGPDKALYSYPVEHYSWWQEQMPDVEFPHGKFGENLTTEGLLEGEVCIGDEFQIGTAVVRVSQPRLPCYKLGIKFGRNDVIKTFQQSARSGIYFSVVKEGEIQAGDEINFLRSDEHHVKLEEVAKLFSGKANIDPQFIQNALDSNLAEQMKMFIRGSFLYSA